MTPGRTLAASPKSASQISPGRGFIEQVEDFLCGGARARDVKDVVISELYYLGDALSAFCGRLRFPGAQPSIEFLRQCVQACPRSQFSAPSPCALATYATEGARRLQCMKRGKRDWPNNSGAVWN